MNRLTELRRRRRDRRLDPREGFVYCKHHDWSPVTEEGDCVHCYAESEEP